MATDNKWRFDKHISIGHLLTTLAVAAGAFLWLADVDKRVDLNTAAINNTVERIDRTEARRDEQFGQILKQLESIEQYLRGENGR